MGFVPLFGRQLVDAGSRGHGSSAGRESVGVAPAGAWPQGVLLAPAGAVPREPNFGIGHGPGCREVVALAGAGPQ